MEGAVSVERSVSDEGASRPQPGRPRGLAKVAEALAGAGQAFVLFGTFLLGLGWPAGWTYPAALLQAAVAFGPLLWLARERRLGLLLLVPVVSGALSVGLLMAGEALSQTAP